MPKKSIKRGAVSTSILWFPAALAIVLACFCFLPRVSQSSRHLTYSVLLASAALLVFTSFLRRSVIAAGRALTLEYAPKPVHYVQLCMHSCIYAYWGWYWREVYHYVPLILGQIVFAYALDMLVCWSRRDRWLLGFGPIPIILSTNLFLWFRDDWFFLQFVMISIGVVAKEYVKWQRDGRSTHIFNPSAVGLFIFSVILIATRSTDISWGMDIAATLHRPPNIYLEIFVIGLVVQALFSVTLVTLSAAAMLYALNMLYTHETGVYQFIDSNIPVSVFLGLHLLVTDPATSPKSNSGKVIFGGLYGVSVFCLYSFLTLIHTPRFYDKLLCVPPLNLSVRFLDRIGHSLDSSVVAFFKSIRLPEFVTSATPRQLNFAFMSIWIILFTVMMTTGFVATTVVASTHPGGDPEFWNRACDAQKFHACNTWVEVLDTQCARSDAQACLTLGSVADEGRVVPRDAKSAGLGLGKACDLGAPNACTRFVEFVKSGGDKSLSESCDHRDGPSCFLLGTVRHLGKGVDQNDTRALEAFQKSCQNDFLRGCGVLGDMYLTGQGTQVDAGKALANFEKACSGGWGQSCASAGMVYRSGAAGKPDFNLSQKRFAKGCELGFVPACRFVHSASLLSSATP